MPDAELAEWLQALGWEAVLNRKGTTWRKLDPALQAMVTDAASAGAVMRSHPSVVKRPVVRWPNGRLSVGFSPAQFAALQGACSSP